MICALTIFLLLLYSNVQLITLIFYKTKLIYDELFYTNKTEMTKVKLIYFNENIMAKLMWSEETKES